MKAAASTVVSARERTVALILLGVATLLRIPYILHYRFNSDESQHLHVVWGWTRGLLPYRDVSDNHPPLFHLLMAPVLALVGERPDALTVMRFAVAPLALAAIWLTWLVAKSLFGPRAALWSAVLLALHYEFFFKSLEFRTDNLWNLGWLAALAAIAGAPASVGRAAFAGAAVGGALCVSQKTVLMAAALAGAAAVVVGVSPEVRRAVGSRRLARLACAATAGFALPPLAVAIGFAAAGCLGALAEGVVGQNLLPGLGSWSEPWRPFLLAGGAAAAIWAAAPRLRSAGADGVHGRRVLVALAAAFYVLGLEGAWPLLTGQDYLPVFPPAAVFAVAGLQRWERRRAEAAGVASHLRPIPATALVALLAVEATVILFKGPLWLDRTTPQTALVSDVLRLTGRDDPLVDTKGETVFRRRAFFPVLETITIEKLRRGMVPDTLENDVERTRCFVAVGDSARFPTRGRAFLNENFVPVGTLRVAGKFLPAPVDAGRGSTFAIAIPGWYAVVTPEGPAVGALDGAPYVGPVQLAAGAHTFAPRSAPGDLAVVWARAVERGFSPFTGRTGRS